MSSYTVLRKLEQNEVNKNRSGIGPNITTSCRFRSKVDLFSRLDTVREAIHKWKQTNVFLRSNVATIDGDLFFVLDEKSSANINLENVHFLRIKGKPVDEDGKTIFNLVMEKIQTDWINVEKEHGLMWRLVLLEVKHDAVHKTTVYELIWQWHHIMGDGISCKLNHLLLLETIQKSLTGEKIELRDSGLYQGTSTIFEPEAKLITNRVRQIKSYRTDFSDPEKAKLHSSLTHESISLGENFELVDLNHGGKCFADLNQLIQISKESNFKPKTFTIDEDVFKSLLKKCKQEGVKLTTFLNMIVWIALARLYKRHQSKLEEAAFWVPISLRPYRPEEIINDYMLGYCVGALFVTFKDEFDDIESDSEIAGKFWPLARKNDSILTDLVKTSYEKFAFKVRQFEDPEREIGNHTGVSNIGIIDVKPFSENDIFQLEDFYLWSYFFKNFHFFLLLNFVGTLENKVFWTVGFNSYFMDPLLIDEFIGLCKDMLFKISDSK